MSKEIQDALIVGINKYDHLTSLTAPANDAEAIAQRLSESGRFQIVRLPYYPDDWDKAYRMATETGAVVTSKQLKEALIQLFTPPSNAIPDTALFYFSGHGLLDEQGVVIGFLATSDVDPDNDKWGVSLQWLQQLLQKSPIKQLVIWLDCCHSGELLNFRKSLEDANPGAQEGFSRSFMTASRSFEKSHEQAYGQNKSVFTAALLEGLDPLKRPDHQVTNYTLVDGIKKALQSEMQRPMFYNYGKPILLTTVVAQGTTNNSETDICPYKGLAYFDLKDAEIFYGRTALTDRLIDKIVKHNFLAVIGPSGSGKSSVVRAGLLNELKLEKRQSSGSAGWQYRYEPFTPGEHPFKKLKQVLGTRSSALGKVIQKDPHARVVLFIDQFEECFTLCQDPEERQQFFDCLLDTLEQTAGKLRLIIAMRADFLGKCAEYERLANKIKVEESFELVTPMSESELREAIVEPAKQAGVEVEAQLVNRMIEDVKDYPGSLPLLQFTLTELWKIRKEPYFNFLTLSNYNTLNGIKGTLETSANNVFQSLSDQKTASGQQALSAKQTIARRIFLELVQPGQETEHTRRRVRKQDLVNEKQSETALDEVIRTLVDARLITTTLENPDDPKSPVVLDVVHEALIRHWQTLQTWIEENRDALRVERKLEDEAEEWKNRRKPEDPSQLRQGARLAEAQEYLKNYGQLGLLNTLAEEYIQVSQRVQEKVEQAQAEQIKALQKALNESNLREQAMTVQNKLQSQPVEALLLAIQITGLSIEQFQGEVLSPVLDSLLWAISYVHETNRLSGHTNEIRGVSLSPDGQKFVSCSLDGTLRLWDLEGNPVGKPFETLESDYVTAVAFHPNGQRIISAHLKHESLEQKATLCLWNLKGKRIGKPFEGHKEEITSVAFSPNGTQVVSGSFDETLRMWDLEGNLIGQPLEGHDAPVTAVAFSADGQLLISGSRDGTLRLWDLQGQPVGEPFQAHQDDIITSIAVDPTGQYIASGSEDGILRLWNLQAHYLEVSVQAHRGSISSIAFSSDGQRLITSSSDQDDSTICLWDLNGQQIGHPLLGHEQGVTAVCFDATRELVISGSEDKTLRLWTLDDGSQRRTFHAHTKHINAVAFSPDSQRIISASDDKTIGLWSLDGSLVAPLFKGHEDRATSVAFHPGGELIVSGSADKTLRLWNLQGEMITQPFQGHEKVVNAVAFDPGGKRIVSGSADKTLRLWNLQGEMITQPFQGHENVVCAVAFHPHSELIVSGSHDGKLNLWDFQGNIIRSFQRHKGKIFSISFSPNGQFIVSSGNDRAICLSDIEGNEISPPFKGHTGVVSAVAFSADGSQIVSGSYDKTLRRWDLKGTVMGSAVEGHKDWVTSIAVSSDQRWIVSGSYDKTLRLWDNGSWEVCLELACNRLRNHTLSNEVGKLCYKYWSTHNTTKSEV